MLDEPFTGIDFPMVEGIVDTIEQLREDGISVLYTTHNRFFLENWADSVVVLRRGQVIFDGSTEEALGTPGVIAQIGDWEHLRRRMLEARERVRELNL